MSEMSVVVFILGQMPDLGRNPALVLKIEVKATDATTSMTLSLEPTGNLLVVSFSFLKVFDIFIIQAECRVDVNEVIPDAIVQLFCSSM